MNDFLFRLFNSKYKAYNISLLQGVLKQTTPFPFRILHSEEKESRKKGKNSLPFFPFDIQEQIKEPFTSVLIFFFFFFGRLSKTLNQIFPFPFSLFATYLEIVLFSDMTRATFF